MSIVSKKEYAEMCGMPTNQLAVYVKRGKVFVGDGDMINTAHEVNAIFLKKQMTKKGLSGNDTKPSGENTPASAAPTTMTTMTIPGLGEIQVPDYALSETALKYLDTVKRDKEVKLLEIKEAKLRGEVVPTEVIRQIVTRHNHSILTSMKPAIEQLIDKMAKMHDIASADVATYKGEVINRLNLSITNAAHETAGAVELVIKEYSETRGVGERL